MSAVINDAGQWIDETGQPFDPEIQKLMEVYGVPEPMTSAELDAADLRLTFLVNNVLVADQHAVIAGASKTMKTSIAIDLALSLAKPAKFLGQFWVPESRRVLFLSAESGDVTIQETARRVAESKGFAFGDDENVTWDFWVPRAKNDEQLRILDQFLDQSAATVAIIDPLYQVLDGEDQSNLSMNGQQLRAVAQRCLDRGVTPVLVDHVKRSSANASNNRPLELNDVTGAGKAEFFRQWLLVSRREPFNAETPLHCLWMTVGGSAGHCGLWAVDINETRDDATRERAWSVSVDTASAAMSADADAKEQRKEKQQQATSERHCRQLKEAFISVHPGGLTKTNAYARAGLNPKNGAAALAFLLGTKAVKECLVTQGRREYDGYKSTTTTENSDNSDNSP